MACPILRKLGIPNGDIPKYGGKLFPIGSLCLVGTCGSGFDCRYPSGRVPTHPFRVLGLLALGRSRTEDGLWRYHGWTAL
jgi:hypothetical protein